MKRLAWKTRDASADNILVEMATKSIRIFDVAMEGLPALKEHLNFERDTRYRARYPAVGVIKL